MNNEPDSTMDAAEYAALRQEALWRVGAQQQVIHLVFVAAAALVVIGAGETVDVRVRLLALILGAFLSFVLQARYTQQDLVAQAIRNYMIETLGKGGQFGRWERHLNEYLFQSRETSSLAVALVYLEGALPTIVGALYLAAFLALALVSRTQLANVPLALTLALGFAIDIALGLFTGSAALRVARWTMRDPEKK